MINAAKRITLLSFIFLALTAHAQETKLYWGDTHLHTSYSPDAYMLGNRTTDPDTAYRFAKGLPVIHPGHKARVQIDRPLDFLAVTDHAEFLGLMPALDEGNEKLLATRIGPKFYEQLKSGRVNELFADILRMNAEGDERLAEFNNKDVQNSIWAKIVDAADAHNQPGEFTAFVGWEWSAMPNSINLHRIVFTPDGGDKAKSYLPFSMLDSTKPRDLWVWLETTSERFDTDFVAIGHNMNLSLGRFFPKIDESGNPVDLSYAQARARWEPVEEVVQYKGDSETHPILSPTDEYAAFETYKHLLGETQLADGTRSIDATPSEGAFMRSALKRGLELERKIGENPYKFGVIGASDSHTALSSVEEKNFHGKYAVDSTPENKHKRTVPTSVGWEASSQGLSAVWASDNTRQEITAAFKRKEVYATSGPRISLRTFAGWDFAMSDLAQKDIALLGYAGGVSMGGELGPAPGNKSPKILIQALKDPNSADLERVQVIKGWLDKSGTAHEKVFDAIVSERLKAKVDLTSGITQGRGEVQFETVWEDPEFNSAQSAFYYVRVLEIPTSRHTLLDTIALKQPPSKSGQESTIQERAYSSPIWYSPK